MVDNELIFPEDDDMHDDMQSVIEFVGKFVRQWKWFVLSVAVMMAGAYMYLRFSTPVYSVVSDIKLKENTSGGGAAVTIEDIAMLGAVDNVSDEAEVIRSRTMVRSAINRLGLHTSYIVSGRVKDTELYKHSPVMVGMEQSRIDSLSGDINFEMQLREDDVLHVWGEIGGRQVDTLFATLPALMQTRHGNISFVRREGVKASHQEIAVSIASPNKIINSYRNNLTVAPMGGRKGNSTLLTMTFNTPYPNKGIDFLTTLVDVYNNEMIEDKNMEARNTQQFINDRIAIIDKELSSADMSVEEYKRTQGLTDLQVDLQKNIQMGSQYEQRLVEVETQLNVVNSLNEYVNDEANANRPIPSNIGINDPTLVATANEYNKLLLERERMAQSMTDENPVMRRLDEQIAGLRQGINLSIGSVEQGLNIQRRDARNQANMYGGRLGSMPTQEREFVDLTREQQIKQNLFLMLLQKREENALALAATSNTAKIINEAITGAKVFPKNKIIYLAALLMGLLIPAVVIYLMDLLHFRIKTRADVERVSKVGILGEIPSHKQDTNMLVAEGDTSQVNEAFRMLRTNLMLTLGAGNKVVSCTSTVPGEGKTFVAMNLAASLALLNKRVLLMGMDLRLPRLKEYMNIKDKKDGLTNYLSGFVTDWHELVIDAGFDGNLNVIHSGHIPPNPAELLSRDKLDELMAELRKEYDYIIIDSAPVSLVTDTLIINRVADANIYVARAGHSNKSNLRYANGLQSQKRLKNMLLVVNDVKEFYHGYGYGYGYGYGK